MKDSIELAIVIVAWNVRELLSECLHSIDETVGTNTHIKTNIYVVDNNSSDMTAEMVKKDFPKVHLFALDKNIGFGRGNNVALREIETPYILLLNPDTKVLPGSIELMLKILEENEDVAMVGPKIIDASGRIDRSCRRFPTMKAALHQFTILKNFGVFSRAHSRYMMKECSYDQTIEVDQIIGACMLLKGPILNETGFFDEDFFMFYEEVDLCYRIKEAGYRILFTPDTHIIHLADQSTRQVWGEMLFQKMKSLLVYFEKREHRKTLALFKPVLKIGLLMKLIKDIIEMSFKTGWHTIRITHHKSSQKATRYKQDLKQNIRFLIDHTVAILLL